MSSTALSALTADPTFETRIATAADDIEEKSSGTISTNINDLDMGYDGNTRQTVGLRFTGIDVPQGAVITNAYIQFTSDEVGTGAASFVIRGEDADDSAAFTAIKFNVSSRPTTDASVDWTPASWTVRGEAGIAERTPDLKAIVQEIIDRGGWAALNDMAFTLIGTGTRVAKSYEGSAAGAPLLHIEYYVPAAGSPVAFNTPADIDTASNQIAELASAGTKIGITASASDPDPGSTVVYSLDDQRFAIDSNGVITRSGTGTLDFETQASITLTVTATSSDQSTATQTFTIGVLNSQEPASFNTPADTDTANNQIAEGAAAGTVVGITASASDPDAGDTISYSLDDSRFAIDANGVITRSGTGTLDFETQASITLTVTATSSDQSTATQTFTLGILNSAEPVAFNTPADTDTASNQIAEGAATGTVVGITASASDPDAGDTISYSLDDSRFAIDANGVITRSGTGTLDFETQASITLTVTATSSDQSTATRTFTLGILNSAEPVAFNTPADADTAANQIAERAAAGAVVGITASASDPDAGDTISYSLDDSRFAIDANGVITRSGTGTLDFETQASITLTVTATSSDQSTATQTFTIGVLNSQEPVAFNTPADADTTTNQIAQNAVAGAKVGITASASDPDAGDTVTYSLNDSRFAIDANGVITRSGTGTLNAQSQPSINLIVTATSSDGGTASETFNLNVTSGANGPPTSATLVHTVLTSQWSPASPDPSGITYISHLGTLFVSDGEVDEMSIFQGKNLFETSLNGTLVRSLTTISFSDEPSGVAYNPTNHHLYFTDDTGTKSVYELNPGTDGLYNTSDDIVTSFKTSAFGSTDPEGLSYDPNRGVLYLANGVNNTIYTINPGANGKFDGVPSVGGDDVVTSFAIGTVSNGDPCVEYDPVHDLLYIVKSRTEVAMTTPTGEFLGTLDISAAHARKVAGMALAPSSDDPNQMSLYIVDRGVDNDANPNENDGKMYEFRLDHWLLS
ncbi:RTX toxin (plasmid) [Sinorhizobium chiapasense]